MISDYVTEGYDKEDILQEKKFLKSITDELKVYGINFSLVEIKDISELEEKLAKYDKDKIVIFNWAEEVTDKPNTGHLITKFLEGEGYKFSGATTKNLILANDRCQVNRVLRENGVGVPEEYELDDAGIKFPVIVKAKYEHGSFGITTKSICKNKEELEGLKKTLVSEKFTAEQFIDGDEYTISVWGNRKPEVLPVFKINFESNKNEEFKIMDYGCKWDKKDSGYKGIYSEKAEDIDGDLKKSLTDMCKKAYRVMGCRGFARFEVRVQKGTDGNENELYIIDFNPNPNLQPDSSFMKSVVAGGYNYGQAVAKLCEFALDE